MIPIMAERPSGAGDSGRRASVKAGMTPNRQVRTVENGEYGAFARRILRGYSRQKAGASRPSERAESTAL